MFRNFAAYPSFIVFVAFTLAVVITLILMFFWIKIVKRSHIGQQVRVDGPETHLVKQGTPTMAGVAMVVSLVVTLLIVGIWVPEVIGLVVATVAAAVLGFIDDGAKVIFKRSLGLTPTAKLVAQFLIATCFILYVVNRCGVSALINIPFVCELDFGVLTTVVPIGVGIRIPWLYVIFVDLLIVGMCNAVNLSDGLDGLAAGESTMTLLIMAAIAYRANQLAPALVGSAAAGTCIGFLWHNAHPAEIFMGDTGSLSLGMAFGCLSVLTKTEFLSIVIGGMFVLEAVSVMLQVGYYKLTHKRLFLMAPLHHHFEKKG